MDCSGFVLRLYEQFGVFLHRVSAEQAGDGTEVSLSQMKPGDLIFYHGYHDGAVTEGVGHVAIYMGNGKIIHAASEEKGICMDNWDYIPYITCLLYTSLDQSIEYGVHMSHLIDEVTKDLGEEHEED